MLAPGCERLAGAGAGPVEGPGFVLPEDNAGLRRESRAGCLGGQTVFNALTGTSSHELCEAITDPVPPTGWYDNKNGEIGDICAWKFKKVGGFNVQLEWSNKLNKCL